MDGDDGVVAFASSAKDDAEERDLLDDEERDLLVSAWERRLDRLGIIE